MNKKDRIEQKLKKIGTRKESHLKKFTPKFIEMFTFFVKINRNDFLSFCGSDTKIIYDPNGDNAMFVFRKYDNGFYKNKEITTCHPNLLRYAICGKKAWGLWRTLYAEGIAEGSFTKKEILNEFEKRKIKIPDSFLVELEKNIYLKIIKK